MARTLTLVILCSVLVQVAWSYAISQPLADTTACDKFADDFGLIESTLKNGWVTTEGVVNAFVELIADFPKCIVLDPFKTMNCFIVTGKKFKDEADTSKMIFQMMKETMDDLWAQVKEDYKNCTAKA